MTFPTRSLSAVMLLTLAACTDKAALARSDSLESRLTEQQALANQLSAQKDSLTRVVLDADAFLGQMDSAISTVRGLPRKRRAATDPLADQLQARKDMQERVLALVNRAKSTANQLACRALSRARKRRNLRAAPARNLHAPVIFPTRCADGNAAGQGVKRDARE